MQGLLLISEAQYLTKFAIIITLDRDIYIDKKIVIPLFSKDPYKHNLDLIAIKPSS